MTLADVKEQLVERLTPYWERLQESQVYVSLRERYESLSPTQQKIAIAGSSVTALLLFLFLFPFSYLSTASESIATFEHHQKLMRNLFSVNRQLKQTPPLPPPLPVDQLKTMAQGEINRAGLVPEQIVSIEASTFPLGALGPKDLQSQGIIVSLKQLNLKQIVDLGHIFQTLHSTLKLINLDVSANESDSHYFNVVYSLAMFSLPQEPETSAEPPPSPGKRGGRPTPRGKGQ